MATDSDSSSDDSDHYDHHHHLDQEEEEHNSDASNDVESESEFGFGSNSRSNSEEASSDSDDSSSDDEVSSSEILTRNSRGIQLLTSMLDLEASESHSSEDEDDDDDDDNNDLAEHIYEYPNSRQVRRNNHQSFPKFALLPYELRQRIWEIFCPDLTAKGRVYEFCMRPKSPNHPDRLYDVWECHMLEQQTAPARAMSAVYRESREHVLRRFPDVLRFRGGRNMIRWDRENDIAILNVSPSGLRGMADTLPHPIPGFSDQIRNMAIDDVFFHNLGQAITDLPELQRLSYAQIFRTFCPQIKRVFRSVQDDECSALLLRWCGARDSHHFLVRTEKEEPGVGENAEYMYCWPSTTTFGLVPETLRMEFKDGNGNYTLQPLIRFSWERGLARFEKLVKKYDNPNCTLSDTDSNDEDEHEDEEPDEYESSGIDDSEIIEDEEGGSESEDDLVVVADGSDLEEEDSSDEEGLTIAGHWNGTHDGPIEITDDSDDESPSGNANRHHYPGPTDVARFSSIEPSDSSTMDEESSSPHRARPSRSAGSGRKRVLESDSGEDEELDGPPRKAARISNESRRRPRVIVVLSDDEDEDEEKNSRMDHELNGALRESAEDPVVISDDDEDEEEEGVARRRLKRKAMQRSRAVSHDEDEEEEEEQEEDEMPVTKKIRSRRGVRPPASDTDDDEDEDDDEKKSDSRTSSSDDSSEDDDDEVPVRPLTLVEKLELHRRNNPILDSDDGGGDDDNGSVSGDDYDARNYADFQDDEEGNEIEDEDEGLIMDLADEEDDDEEDEY